MSDDTKRRVNPFTDGDVSLMLHDLDALTRDVHPVDGTEVPHNHHACIRARDWVAQLEAAPTVQISRARNLTGAFVDKIARECRRQEIPLATFDADFILGVMMEWLSVNHAALTARGVRRFRT